MASFKRQTHRDKASARALCQNQKGMAFVTLLTLLPLLLTVLMVYASAAFALRHHTLTTSQCRYVVWQAQTKMAGLLEALLKLNPRAASLRQQRRFAELKVRIARRTGYPAAIAAAEARRLIVIQRQLALRLQQHGLLEQARTIRSQVIYQYQHKVKSQAQVQNVFMQSESETLAVQAEPALDLSPSYKPTNNFSQEQQISVFWQGDLFSHMPSWLLSKSISSGEIKNSCGATLQKKGALWQPTLAGAKP